MTKKKTPGFGSDSDILIKQKPKDEVKPPSKYQVILYNDDFTPMDLVTAILISIFKHDDHTALQITINIHKKGKGIAGGPYSKEIAETKALQSANIVRSLGFPLMAKEEKID